MLAYCEQCECDYDAAKVVLFFCLYVLEGNNVTKHRNT